LEILITVVISAFGLIGLAGLQISSVNATTISSANTQTMIAIKEMVGQLIANKPAALNGEFNITAANTDTGALRAFSTDLVPANDATSSQTITYRWFNNLNNAVPGVKAGIHCDSSGLCAIKVQLSEAVDSMEQIISVQL
jgi:Tfp pilus assembly protein PilV